MHHRSHDQGGVCIQADGLYGGGGRQTPLTRCAYGEGGWADLPPQLCLQTGVRVGGVGQNPQDTWDTTGYGQRAGGTHPTGILSCLIISSKQLFCCLFSGRD